MKRCKNCDTPLSASFCSECGQKDLDLERPFLKLAGDVVEETLDVDGRAARTVWTMFTRPGELTARFLAGHRRQFTPPVRLYLVVSVLFFFVMAWVVKQGILFEITAESVGEVRVLAEDLPRLMFVFLPVFALLLKIVYWRRLYFDHLIHALHLHTFGYIILAILLPLEQLADEHWYWFAAHLLLFGYFAVYLAMSFRRVYEAGWLVTVVKTIAVYFGYTAVLAVSLEFMSGLAE